MTPYRQRSRSSGHPARRLRGHWPAILLVAAALLLVGERRVAAQQEQEDQPDLATRVAKSRESIETMEQGLLERGIPEDQNGLMTLGIYLQSRSIHAFMERQLELSRELSAEERRAAFSTARREAMEFLREAFPDSPLLPFLEIRENEELSQQQQIAALRALGREHPSSLLIERTIQEELHEARDFDAALDSARSFVERNPENPEGWGLLYSQVRRNGEDPAEKNDVLSAWLARHPDDPAALDTAYRSGGSRTPEERAAMIWSAVDRIPPDSAARWCSRFNNLGDDFRADLHRCFARVLVELPEDGREHASATKSYVRIVARGAEDSEVEALISELPPSIREDTLESIATTLASDGRCSFSAALFRRVSDPTERIPDYHGRPGAHPCAESAPFRAMLAEAIEDQSPEDLASFLSQLARDELVDSRTEARIVERLREAGDPALELRTLDRYYEESGDWEKRLALIRRHSDLGTELHAGHFRFLADAAASEGDLDGAIEILGAGHRSLGEKLGAEALGELVFLTSLEDPAAALLLARSLTGAESASLAAEAHAMVASVHALQEDLPAAAAAMGRYFESEKASMQKHGAEYVALLGLLDRRQDIDSFLETQWARRPFGRSSRSKEASFAEVALEAGLSELALDYYTAIEEAGPQDDNVLREIIDAIGFLEPERRRSALGKLGSLDESPPEVASLECELLVEIGRYDEARDVAQTALSSQDPNAPPVELARCLAHAALEAPFHEAAEPELIEAVSLLRKIRNGTASDGLRRRLDETLEPFYRRLGELGLPPSSAADGGP